MSRDTNFYYSFLVLPTAKRRAIVAVWDFCRAVDDAVDLAEEGAGAEAHARELARWRSELDCCYGSGDPETDEGRRLAPVIGRFHLPRAPFDDLIDGVAMDATPRRYETFEDLYGYCLRVASSVGLTCIEIFGYRDPGTRDYAVALGVALQLTNIIRDLPADLARGRLYLPQEDLR
ncbi:MAG: squalene/phytoene synthase family protein, partial [Acidobacteria bacterium]|nr:squalene/phytoene synthase family protein [Acidobacteriota bacterium]